MTLKKKHTSHIIMFVCFSLFAGLVACSPSNIEPASEQTESIQQNKAYPGPFRQSIENDIQTYEELLSQKDLSSEDRLRIESLLAEAQQMATMIDAPPPSKEQIEADIAEHEALVAEEKIEPTATPELGILESGIFFEVHVPRRVKIENIWQGYVDGNLTRVYAGRAVPDYRIATSVEKDDSQFGGIYVMTFLPDGTFQTSLHITAEETGPLRIQEATEEFLILGSTGTKELTSQDYYYGLSVDRLADSPNELNAPPTATPNPESYP